MSLNVQSDSSPIARTELTPESTVSSKKIVAGTELIFDFVSVFVWVVTCDLLIFRQGTFLAWSILALWAVLFVPLAKRRLGHRPSTLVFAVLLIALSAKLVWSGSWLQVALTCFLLLAYGMALSGSVTFLPELLAFLASAIGGACQRAACYRFGFVQEATGNFRPLINLQVILPVLAVAVFGTIFVVANPDLTSSIVFQFQESWRAFSNLLKDFGVSEAVFWFVCAWLILGLLYPAKCFLIPEKAPPQLQVEKADSSLYAPYRNTLLSVILLFGIYLVFEFSTLWFREFPENFYYAGYAHQGAFWLTVALGLSTVTLSLIFQGNTLADPRLRTLKKLAFVWSLLNFVLSLAVYNRLLIYVQYNGMTHLRMVGLIGITCVVVGFALVVVKLLKDKGFVWLIHRQLWVPVFGCIVFALLPVDWIVNTFNTREGLAGRDKAIVQIAAHRCSAAGILPITELVDHPTEEIRNGIRALLALWAQELEVAESSSNPLDAGPGAYSRSASRSFRGATQARSGFAWTSHLGHSCPWLNLPQGFANTTVTPNEEAFQFQYAEHLLRRRLSELRPYWQEYAETPKLQQDAINEFYKYTYKWY